MKTFDTTCPECEWEFKVEDPEPSEIIVCQDCKLNLKINGIDNDKGVVEVELTETAADDWGQ